MYYTQTEANKFEISWAEDYTSCTINGKTYPADMQKRNDNSFHLILDEKSYTVFVSEINKELKTVKLRINGTPYALELKDELDALLKKMGINKHAAQKISEIKAPMPGMVKEVSAEAGQAVKKGDMLLVLEAMKMENNLKSPIDSVIKSVNAKAGKAVEKNEVLIVFE